jgi:hypothetical protein
MEPPHVTTKYQKMAKEHTVAASRHSVGGLRTGTTTEHQEQRAVSLPPPLPDRRRGGISRQSEPALYPSMPRVEMMAFEVQRQERHQVKDIPTYRYRYLICLK